jgi:hypothetical protein
MATGPAATIRMTSDWCGRRKLLQKCLKGN